MTSPNDALQNAMLQERCLLNCLKENPDLFNQIEHDLARDFLLPDHAALYRSGVELHAEGLPLDGVEWPIKARVDPTYIATVIDSGALPPLFPRYLAQTRKLARDRRKARLLEEMPKADDARLVQLAGDLQKLLTEGDSWKEKPTAHKVANWQTCAEVKPEMRVDLWPGRVPLKVATAYLGDPNMAKSLATLDFMARLSRGKPFLDGAENLHGVVESILLSTEDDPNTVIVPRLMAAGADLSRIHLVDTVRMFDGEEALDEERQLTLESDLSVIREKIESNPAIKLLVVDPISNYLGSKNLMKEQEIRSVLMPVVTMAQELNIAVIVVMHHSKAEGRSAMHKAIGAVGAVGCLRMAWSFVKSPDDETTREMLQSKHNLGRFPGLRFTTDTVKVTIDGKVTEQAVVKYVGVSTVSIETAIATQEDQEARRERPAIAFLKECLPKDGTHHSVPLIEKAQEKGISRDKLFRARTSLGINTEKIGGQWFWSWPGDN